MKTGVLIHRQVNQRLSNPANREDVLELPLEYEQSCANEQFLIFYGGLGDADRIFIFGTNQSHQILSQSQNWFGDGIVKIDPQIFFR